jgi:hypothetical protein
MTPGIEEITLRDFFAVFAVQALISEPSLKATETEFAQRAYVIADAMLKERAKNE